MKAHDDGSRSDRRDVGVGNHRTADALPTTIEQTLAAFVEREVRRVLPAVLPEILTATRTAAVEMVPPSVFAREHSLHEATVCQMAKDGRIEAVRIGKRQWRVRRDSPIGQPMARGATSADTPAERARRLVAKLK